MGGAFDVCGTQIGKGWKKKMKHFGTQIIKTERLTLRRFTIADADMMFNNWASDDEVTR